MDLKKNGFYEIENDLEKTLNIKGKIKNNNQYICIEDNNKNKGKNKIIRNITDISNNIIFIKMLLLIKLFIQISSNYNWFELQLSNRTIRIKETGIKNIFTCGSTIYYPNSLYINRINQNIFIYYYEHGVPETFSEFLWINTIVICIYIFYEYSDIREIDLSNYDFSKSNSMNGITLKVVFVGYMSLECSSLTSFYLSNLNTFLKVTNVIRMFYCCINLEYINLHNFDESQITWHNQIFEKIPDNIIICINEDKTNNKKYSKISVKLCYNINYIINWNYGQNNIVSGKCIYNCENRLHYKYEYNRKKICNLQEIEGL